MAKKLLDIEAVQGAWAVMPTPSLPNAGNWSGEDTVDRDETARALESLHLADLPHAYSLR